MLLQHFLLLYIQTLHYDCSHIADVHLLLLIFLRMLNLDIIVSTPPLE